MAVEPSGEIEFQQGHLHGAARRARQSDDLVDLHRRGAEQIFDQPERVLAVHPLGSWLIGRRCRAYAAFERANRLDHIGGVLHERRSVADQLVAALRARIERRSWHRHHLPACLGGEASGDKRSRSRRRFDHHRPAAHPGDDAIAIGEMPRSRFGARGHFRQHQPAIVHRPLPRLVFGRIEYVDPARDHTDCAGVDRAIVRCAVDSARQTGNDDQLVLAEIVRKAAGEAAGRGRRVASADQRDRLAIEQVQIALRNQQRRRVLELREQARVEPLSEGNELPVELLDLRDLTLRIRYTPQRRSLPAAAAGEVRDCVKRRCGGAETSDQLAIGNRPYTRRPQQSQAVGEVFDPIRGSVPFVRRRTFSRCFHNTSNAKPSSIGK